jgi:C-terminal processing protease CtpA/Prc
MLRSAALTARLAASATAWLLLLTLCAAEAARAQTLGDRDREKARLMLKFVRDDVKEHYYDPSFHGVDIEARYKEALGKLDQAASNGQAFGIIAQFLMELNDSHTFFLPPPHAAKVDYGWRMQMIGPQCFVTAVKPGSDAEAKGLKPGDILHVIDGYKPTRENMWQLQYLYNALQPRPAVQLVVQSPGEAARRLELAAKVTQGKKEIDLSKAGFDFYDLVRNAEDDERLNAHRYHELGEELFIWKMPQFDLPKEKVDELMGKVRKSKALIIDLRGNPGGYEETLLRLIGNLFDRDVKVGDIQRRKESKPLVAKTRGSDAYKGKVILLVDSDSGSAAELLARVVQLEKRGTVVGDRTAGAVMRSRGHSHQIGVDTLLLYGTSVTDADIRMADGNSLEKTGVTPDEPALPTGAALRAGRDPVLAFAASLAGVQMDSEKAGGLFPLRWKQ